MEPTNLLPACPTEEIVWFLMPEDIFLYLLTFFDVGDIWNLCLSHKKTWNWLMREEISRAVLNVSMSKINFFCNSQVVGERTLFR